MNLKSHLNNQDPEEEPYCIGALSKDAEAFGVKIGTISRQHNRDERPCVVRDARVLDLLTLAEEHEPGRQLSCLAVLSKTEKDNGETRAKLLKGAFLFLLFSLSPASIEMLALPSRK